MGTYTTNYDLFMPSIGEQGWGDLVNGNFTTIDATMKGLDTRIGTLETEADAVEERVTTLEKGEFESITAEVGNFSKIRLNATLSYEGYSTITIGSVPSGNTISNYTLLASIIPVSGVVSVCCNSSSGFGYSATMTVLTTEGAINRALSTTQTEYTVENALNIFIWTRHADTATITVGNPMLISN